MKNTLLLITVCFIYSKMWHERAMAKFNKKRRENGCVVWTMVILALLLLITAIVTVSILGKSMR